MSDIQKVLDEARARATELALPYSGVLDPAQAFSVLNELSDAVLVDVRSAAEWQFVGVVPQAIRIELKLFPGMVPNERFIEQLIQQVDKQSPVLFLCRSGARSDEAARLAWNAGFLTVYNVAEGFEGDKDGSAHRGTVNGWKARGLPWLQS